MLVGAGFESSSSVAGGDLLSVDASLHSGGECLRHARNTLEPQQSQWVSLRNGSLSLVHYLLGWMCYGCIPQTGIKVGLTLFRLLKPPQVRKMTEKNRLTCGCKEHENARKALQGLRNMTRVVHDPRHGGPCPPNAPCRQRRPLPTSVHECIEQALCPIQPGHTTYAARCVEGSCSKCCGGLSSKLAKSWCSKELNGASNAPKVCVKPNTRRSVPVLPHVLVQYLCSPTLC